MAGAWKVDRDYLPVDGVPSRVGTKSKSWRDGMAKDPEAVRFRLLDDDGNVYYGGILIEAEDGESAGYALLEWGMRDAGAVALEVREGPREPWTSYMG